MSYYNYTGQPYQPPLSTTSNTRNPFHQRVLGYDIYQNYYDPAYRAPRGCCGMPVTFWWFVFGIFFPPLWIVAACCLFSRNPYERVWARASVFSLLLTIIVFIIIGSIGRSLWWDRHRL